MQALSYYYRHPNVVGSRLLVRYGKWLPDAVYLKLKFRADMGYKLNLKSPKTFNEKLQWLKLYDQRPQYTIMVDKVKAKEYVASLLGEEYIIPTLGVWDNPNKIDFDALPDRFVLKCNHNSGMGMYICKDKSKMDVKAVISGLRRGLRQDYFGQNREWPYKDVPRLILAEQYLEPEPETNDLRDYKFFCFDGKVKCFKIDFNRQVDHHANYFTPEGRLLPFGEKDYPPQPEKELAIPKNLPKMIELAEKIAEGHPFLRVDFYDYLGKIYFGEITFYPASGTGRIEPKEWDVIMGEWIPIPTSV